MLFNIFTTASPAKSTSATTTRAGCQPQRPSSPSAPISKISRLRGIFHKLRRFVGHGKDEHHCDAQGAPDHGQETKNMPDFVTSSAAPFKTIPTIKPIQLTQEGLKRPELVDASNQLRTRLTPVKSDDSFMEPLNADTRRDSGRSWCSSWFDFDRVTPGLEWQEPSDVSEGEEACLEDSGEGSRASGRSWSSSWIGFDRIPAESEAQRVAWQEPSDVSEGGATCSDSGSGEHSWASTDASVSFQWSNEGLAWANSRSGSPSPSPSAESLPRMPRGRQGGRMYGMPVTSAYGSSTDEEAFVNLLLR